LKHRQTVTCTFYLFPPLTGETSHIISPPCREGYREGEDDYGKLGTAPYKIPKINRALSLIYLFIPGRVFLNFPR